MINGRGLEGNSSGLVVVQLPETAGKNHETLNWGLCSGRDSNGTYLDYKPRHAVTTWGNLMDPRAVELATMCHGTSSQYSLSAVHDF